MSSSKYDFRDYTNLVELEIVARDKISPDHREVIRNAVKTGNFSSYAQLPGACRPECIETMTIGELRNTKSNETGDQFIDVKAAHKVLFGGYGICKPTIGKPRALALPIQVTYTKGQFDNEPKDPCISSGRHRLLSLCILLSACGLSDYEIDEVPVRITSAVVQDEKDFAMIMETNNQSRVQKSRELANHKMVALSITTNDLDQLLEDAQGVYGMISKQGPVFAQAVTLQSEAKVERDTVFAAVKSAWTNVKQADKENGKRMRELFSPGSTTELSDVAEYVAGAVASAYDNALQQGATNAEINRVFKETLAVALATRISVVVPVYKTKEERDREALATLEAKALVVEMIKQGLI